jgi:hypothetical protein
MKKICNPSLLSRIKEKDFGIVQSGTHRVKVQHGERTLHGENKKIPSYHGTPMVALFRCSCHVKVFKVSEILLHNKKDLSLPMKNFPCQI